MYDCELGVTRSCWIGSVLNAVLFQHLSLSKILPFCSLDTVFVTYVVAHGLRALNHCFASTMRWPRRHFVNVLRVHVVSEFAVSFILLQPLGSRKTLTVETPTTESRDDQRVAVYTGCT